jgi:hypothetical protein
MTQYIEQPHASLPDFVGRFRICRDALFAIADAFPTLSFA